MADLMHQSIGNGGQGVEQGSHTVQIPVRFRIHRREIPGIACTVSPLGLQVVSAATLTPGTPLSLQIVFGGNCCFMNLAGQVASCLLERDGPDRRYQLGISFAGIRELEYKILHSAVQQLTVDPSLLERSLVTIEIAKDAVAEEASRVAPGTPEHPVATHPHRGGRKWKGFTPDPIWVMQLKEQVAPCWHAVMDCPLVQEAAAGTLSMEQMRAWLIQLYPFIETFPKWIALNIARTQDPVSRAFMIDNVRVEKRHAEQWVHMAEGFGIDAKELFAIRPIPQVEALTHWLWSINTQGSLPEAVAATNYAIEGITHDISTTVVKGFPKYEGRDGLRLTKKAYSWMEAHAAYDDLHPIQALHVMKLYTTHQEQEDKVIFAAKRSLEYMLMALNACYTEFPPEKTNEGIASASPGNGSAGIRG